MITTTKSKSLFSSQKYINMTTQQKIYFIIQQRKSCTLDELVKITNLTKTSIIRGLYPLIVKRKIKSESSEGLRYFMIKNKK